MYVYVELSAELEQGPSKCPSQPVSHSQNIVRAVPSTRFQILVPKSLKSIPTF
jgi:hypothetical protein